MQFIGVATIFILISHYEPITPAPTDTAAPGELESANSQLIDTGLAHGFANHQKERKSSDFYEYRYVVGHGVQRALDECRQKFKWDRWNCPKKAFTDPFDGQSTLPSNKELGLTRALIASSVVLSIIKSCSIGTNSMCACTNPTIVPVSNRDIFVTDQQLEGTAMSGLTNPATISQNDHMIANQPAPTHSSQLINQNEQSMREAENSELMVQDQPIQTDLTIESLSPITEPAKNSNFAWAGCDEIVKFGFKVAKNYLNSQDNSHRDSSWHINAHNDEAGRQAVKQNMRRKCKCHGTSGTCQVNTCWTVVPDISEVAEHLKKRYRVAAKVGAVSAKETDPASLTKELSAISSDKLVFADPSPDYCYENKQLGINGTLGRYCSRAKHRSDGTEVSRSERDSCDRLCTKCGYKIKRERINVEKQCDCRFVYCCRVECKRCPHVEETFKCVRHS